MEKSVGMNSFSAGSRREGFSDTLFHSLKKRKKMNEFRRCQINTEQKNKQYVAEKFA